MNFLGLRLTYLSLASWVMNRADKGFFDGRRRSGFSWYKPWNAVRLFSYRVSLGRISSCMSSSSSDEFFSDRDSTSGSESSGGGVHLIRRWDDLCGFFRELETAVSGTCVGGWAELVWRVSRELRLNGCMLWSCEIADLVCYTRGGRVLPKKNPFHPANTHYLAQDKMAH